MTIRQEAIQLIREQPEQNIRILVALMKTMKTEEPAEANPAPARRIGVGRDEIRLPDDFFAHFDDANEEIARMFEGGE